MKSFIKNVTTGGTAEQLSSTTLNVTSFIIRAKSANTGNVFIADNSVDNTDPALTADQAISWSGDASLKSFDLSRIWLDVSVNGEGVDVWYMD